MGVPLLKYYVKALKLEFVEELPTLGFRLGKSDARLN